MPGDTFWIGTGWKMNKTRAEARAWVDAVLAGGNWPRDGLQPFAFPPFTALEAVRDALGPPGTAPLLMGAQTMHWAAAGAFTGEVSAPMLVDAGCDLVELGHSERRALFGETDAAINAKVRAALAHGLRPLVCVGETAEERRLGAAVPTVVRQATMAFAGVSRADLNRCLIAYEPVWAIGEGGTPATPADVTAIHGALKRDFGAAAPVLYGGSVNLDNAADLAALPQVDGLFVGRAAWQAEGFLALVDIATRVRGVRVAV